MHYQGRRWVEGKIYPSVSTFRSYGVDFETEVEMKKGKARAALPPRLAVPGWLGSRRAA